MVAPALALDEGLDADLEHMRRPRWLWKDAGAKGFFTLNAIIGGNVLTAQTFPILVVDMALRLLAGSGATGAVAPLYLTTIATGFVSTIVVGLMGPRAARAVASGLDPGVDADLLGPVFRLRRGARCINC
jgi:hypothetical protein